MMRWFEIALVALTLVTGLVWLPAEAGVPLLAAGVAALAALLPAMQAYRTDVADLLSQP